MIRIGISGYNPITEQFLTTLESLEGVALLGIHTDVEIENVALAGTGLVAYNTFNDLVLNSDVVVLTQTETNALPLAEKVIKHGKHVYIHHLRHFQDDYIGYLVKLANEAAVKTCVHFDLMFHPVVNKLQTLLGDPQIIDVSLGRMEGSIEDVSGDRYLIAAALLVKSLSRRNEVPRVHAQSLQRTGTNGNPIQLRLEYTSGCLANVMLHGDAVPGHNRIRVYQGNGFVEADLDFGLISTQGYTDNTGPMPGNPNSESLINIETLPQPDSGLRHFLNALLQNRDENCINFSRLYDATKAIAPLRQKIKRYDLTVQ